MVYTIEFPKTILVAKNILSLIKVQTTVIKKTKRVEVKSEHWCKSPYFGSKLQVKSKTEFSFVLKYQKFEIVKVKIYEYKENLNMMC